LPEKKGKEEKANVVNMQGAWEKLRVAFTRGIAQLGKETELAREGKTKQLVKASRFKKKKRRVPQGQREKRRTVRPDAPLTEKRNKNREGKAKGGFQYQTRRKKVSASTEQQNKISQCPGGREILLKRETKGRNRKEAQVWEEIRGWT